MAVAILSAALGNLAVAVALAVVALVAGRRTKWQAVAHGAWLLVLVKLLTPPLVTVPLPGLACQESEPVAWATVVVGVWLAGACAWAAIALLRVRQFGRLLRFADAPPPALATDVAEAARRIGLRRTPRVRVLPGGVAPLVWAVGRPTVFVPASLLARVSSEQRLTLLAHEFAHLRRGDHFVRWVETVALAVWWWCPLAWLARRELRRLEEEACDAEVTAAFPGSGHAYASAILETIDMLAGATAVPALASGLGDVSSLRRRLTLVLDGQAPERPSHTVRLALALVGVAILAVGPRPIRLTAAAAEYRWRSAAPVVRVPMPIVHLSLPATLVADDEPVQFLPTPVRLAAPPTRNSATCMAAALSPDGSRLALADGNDVTVSDPASGRVLVGHIGPVTAIAFSPDGARIATASQDGSAKLWDAATGRELHTLTGHASWVSAVAFAPDGRMLVTGGYDKTVRVWDVATGTPQATWPGHAGGVRAVAFAPDGCRIASGGADHEVRLWDVATGTTTHVLKRHQGPVRAIAFAPDGSRLATGSDDGTVRLWHPTTGREIGSPLALPDFVTALTFTLQGHALFAGTFGGHLLNIDPTTMQPRTFVGGPAHAEAVTAISLADGLPISVAHDRTVLAWPPAARTSQMRDRPIPLSVGDWAARLWPLPRGDRHDARE